MVILILLPLVIFNKYQAKADMEGRG